MRIVEEVRLTIGIYIGWFNCISKQEDSNMVEHIL